MIREEIKQLKTGPRELRKFGLTVGAVFLLLGLWFLYRGKSHYLYFVAPGTLLLVCGAVLPRSLKFIFIGWMTMAFLLGFIASSVLLTMFFYFIVTFIGLIARLTGKDFLQQFGPRAESYWIMRDRRTPKQKTDYEQQF